jgi:hypothetical protein
MEDLVYFNSIPVTVPYERIYKRLGYQQDVTKIAPQQKAEIERVMEESGGLIDLKGVAKKVSVQEKKDSQIILPENIVFESKNLLSILKDCREIVVMAVTGGSRIINAVGEDSCAGNLTRGVVLDAAASEIVDSALDWIMSYFNNQLLRENRCLTKRRFSAGYGDFSLENQEKIFNMLKLDKLGISLTSGFMLIPQKSVTAIAGIQDFCHLEERSNERSEDDV